MPTAVELGYDVTWANPNWWIAPKGTPQDRVDTLASALEQAMDDPEIQTWFRENTLDPYWIDGAAADADALKILGRLEPVAATIK